MANKNDEIILQLQKQIDEKKAELKKVNKFNPKTNCTVEFNGERINIGTLDRQKALDWLIKLNAQLMSAKDLNLENDYLLCGYSLQDWVDDLQSQFDVLNKREETANLKRMEAKLNKLLSNDKRVELELDAIAELLGL